MSDMKILVQLIRETVLVPVMTVNNTRRVTLRESQAQDSVVVIHNLPIDALVINTDAFSAPKSIFNNTKHECRRADYVIISEEKNCLIYIEMKRTRGEWNHVVNQLLGAQCFIRYCQEIGKGFWKEKNFLHGYKSRFVSIGHTFVPKRAVHIDRSAQCHDTPGKAMKVDWAQSVQFNRLACLNA